MKLHYAQFLLLLSRLQFFATSYLDYADALSKSILFFEGQRSGYLPPDQRLTWRGNSGLRDGSTVAADLTGGYYDAGDNVKFNFPMAFTTTMLAWGVVEFGECMPPAELKNSLVAIRWATDYLLKTVSQPDRIYVQPPHGRLINHLNAKYKCLVHNQNGRGLLGINRRINQVGDPIADHNCWERPEDMDTSRTVYAVDAPNPASDIAGETAAALAASSIAFKSSDPGYAETLLRTSARIFKFADSYKGAYSDNLYIRDAVCPFYCDFDGYQENSFYFEFVSGQVSRLCRLCLEKIKLYEVDRSCSGDLRTRHVRVQDELLWAAAWLGRASSSHDNSYLDYLKNNGKTLGAGDNVNEFGWDNKHAGLNVLVSKEVLENNTYSLQSYRASADSFMCTLVPQSNSYHIGFTPGGLIYRPGGSNLQHATTISFLLLVYANYLEKSSQTIDCGEITISPSTLRRTAQGQVNYILGENPKGTSYMVGYTTKYPQRIHHRGSSIPSLRDHPNFIACKEGSLYFNSPNPNPNVLVGAIVGGPGEDDEYEDNRADFRKSEPTTYINAPFVGVVAYFVANPNV
ncbi:hypothetical protein OROMI_033053 [Orobanche minor]